MAEVPPSEDWSDRVRLLLELNFLKRLLILSDLEDTDSTVNLLSTVYFRPVIDEY